VPREAGPGTGVPEADGVEVTLGVCEGELVSDGVEVVEGEAETDEVGEVEAPGERDGVVVALGDGVIERDDDREAEIEGEELGLGDGAAGREGEWLGVPDGRAASRPTVRSAPHASAD